MIRGATVAALITAGGLVACGGGGGGGSAPAVVATATPTIAAPTAVSTAAATIPASGTLAQALPSVDGYGGSIAAQVMQGTGGTVTATVALGNLPTVAGQPAISPYTNAPNGVLVYADFVVSNAPTVNVASSTLTLTFPAGTLLPNVPYYYAFWPGNAQFPAWLDGAPNRYPVTTIVPATQTITIAGASGLPFGSGFVYGFAVYR